MKKHLLSTPLSWSLAHVDQLDVLPVPVVEGGGEGRGGGGRRGGGDTSSAEH